MSKLLVCLKCGDIYNLRHEEKSCKCGETSGKYINDLDAEYSGPAQVIGFANNSFRAAYKRQKYEDEYINPHKSLKDCCMGVEFTAFMIPIKATSVHKVEKEPE